jgi:hypothetical protein
MEANIARIQFHLNFLVKPVAILYPDFGLHSGNDTPAYA